MTPLVKIDNFYLKREDLNQTGSVKDRAIPAQISHLKQLGYQSAVISSTGNAAISAQYFCQKQHIDLTIFVSPHTHQSKLKLLSNYHLSSKPISDAIKYSKVNHSYLLRQSTDPIAIHSYGQIALEIISQLPSVSSIFLPVGSGATLVGLRQQTPKNIKIFAVQSAFNPTITRQFATHQPETNNLTDALTVKYLPLKHQIYQAINHGFTVQNQDIIATQKILQKHHILTSNEGAMSLHACLSQPQLAGANPVIILTGSHR